MQSWAAWASTHDADDVILPAVGGGAKKKLVNYTVLQRVGGGSYGQVYKVQLESGMVCALKVRSKSEERATWPIAGLRELPVLRKVVHPNIAKLLSVRETTFDIQFMLPLYDFDLRQYIRRCPLTESVARKLSGDVCQAVCFIHAKSILHRDIKPANILVQRQPLAAILSDFGCSVSLSSPPSRRMTPDMCTLWYRAPEIMLTHSQYSFPSDVWSLGVSCIEMEHGECPFTESSEVRMMRVILTTLVVPDDDRFRDLCTKLAVGSGGSNSRPITANVLGQRFGERFSAFVKRAVCVLASTRSRAAQLCMDPWLT